MKSAVRRSAAVTALVVAAAAACDETTTDVEEGPYTLTFAGDASFIGPHAGQAIRLGLVSSGGALLAIQRDTIQSTGDTAFSFTFADELEHGGSYEVHYWIDSNFGGGAPGYCDEKAIDHQWNESVGIARSDLEVTVDHDAANTERVCETFAFDLRFAGDASFQTAHGLHPVHVALVRTDGGVLVRDSGTVAANDDPTFVFEFPASLLPEAAYQVHLWIDSNFGGGTGGVCDPPSNDHQWAVDVGTPTDDVDITYDHDPSTATDVCVSFR